MNHKHIKISDIDDMAPGFGVESMEARPARKELGAERIGMTHYAVKPGKRVGFGHNHEEVEEVYVITSGAGRFRVDDDIFEVESGDAVYCAPEAMREWEAGDDGMDVIAFGAHVEGDADMEPGWWPD
jgi:quercetin dioxygenase-like cupin family protein